MKRYLKLDKSILAAFFFMEREKDYGGIHLGVPALSTKVLLILADELALLDADHSRSIPLMSTPEDLPRRIVARCRYESLASLRIGAAADSVTRIQIDNQAGIVELSPRGLAEFESAITLVHKTHGDLLISGDSGLWTDRLWFWPLEEEMQEKKSPSE